MSNKDIKYPLSFNEMIDLVTNNNIQAQGEFFATGVVVTQESLGYIHLNDMNANYLYDFRITKKLYEQKFRIVNSKEDAFRIS